MIIEKGNAFICQVNHRYKYVDSGTLCPTYWVHFTFRTICTMPWTCDTTCVILSRLSLATGQYLRVASYKSFLRLYILPFSVQSIELLMQTNSILSPSSGIIFSILFLPDTYFSHEVGCWQWVKPPCPPVGGGLRRREAVNVIYYSLFTILKYKK